ncbi:HTH myb-type domain-containing protein [Pseudoscourfieldia marina]
MADQALTPPPAHAHATHIGSPVTSAKEMAGNKAVAANMENDDDEHGTQTTDTGNTNSDDARQLPGSDGHTEHDDALTSGLQPNGARNETNRAASASGRRNGEWTEEEHRQFLLGLHKYGKGDWRSISRNCVVTRTPTQVASHAQKYYLRQTSLNSKVGGLRRSIHDMDSAQGADGALYVPSKRPDGDKVVAPPTLNEDAPSRPQPLDCPRRGGRPKKTDEETEENRNRGGNGEAHAGVERNNTANGASSSGKADFRSGEWTEEEHRQFLLGLHKYGKGDWRSISRNCVVTRTPTQVASHAQKYYLRLSSTNIPQRRSIHDIVPAPAPRPPAVVGTSSKVDVHDPKSTSEHVEDVQSDEETDDDENMLATEMAELIPELAQAVRDANLDPAILEKAAQAHSDLVAWSTDYQRCLLNDTNYLQQEMSSACASLSSSLESAEAWRGKYAACSMRAYFLLELWAHRRRDDQALLSPFELTRDLLRRSYDSALADPGVASASGVFRCICFCDVLIFVSFGMCIDLIF